MLIIHVGEATCTSDSDANTFVCSCPDGKTGSDCGTDIATVPIIHVLVKPLVPAMMQIHSCVPVLMEKQDQIVVLT